MFLRRIRLESRLLFSLYVFIIRLVILQIPAVESVASHTRISWFIVLLRAWLTVLIISSNYNPNHIRKFLMLLIVGLFVLIMRFSVKRLLSFYFFFESVLIPIFLLVIGWGYQPERIRAALYIFFYTLLASLPLLAGILVLIKEIGRGGILILQVGSFSLNNIFLMVLRSAFLVKLPIYFFHLWLPKAHVEAPVSGSIVLAGVLLKLGGYGLFLVIILFTPAMVFNDLVSRLSLLGRGLLAIIVLRTVDIKVAIAYSSVVHMRMVIIILISVSRMGVAGAMWIMIAHGLTSSGIFSGANIIYERRHTRSLLGNKGLLSAIPLFTALWFILIVINFAGPFTINLFREIIIISGLVSLRGWAAVPVILLCFFSAAYNLNIYASRQQGEARKIFRFKGKFNRRERFTLFRHVWPALLILGSLILLSNNIKSM